MSLIAFAAASVAAFLIGGAYYALIPSVATEGAPQRSAQATIAVELVRSAAIAALVIGLLGLADVESALSGAAVGAALWTLPVVLLAGSAFHEGTSPRAAAVHAGDWLLKLVAVGAVVAVLR